MIICIDCRHIDSSGIGVYLRGCLPFFLNSDNTFLLIGNPQKLTEFVSGHSNAEVIECYIKPFSLKELLFFPAKLTRHINKADAFFSPYFNIPRGITIPVYTTIHDIIFPDMPELTSKIGLAARMWFYRRAFAKSKKIFTVSEFSKSRVEHYSRLKVPVIVTHIAIRPDLLCRQTKTPKQQTIVFLGNIKKHKGLDYLLDAFILAKKDGLPHKLIIIGSQENFRTADNAVLQKIDSIGSDAVSFTGFISDEQLVELLSSAALLIQPSLYEGFGLPPLEAMVLGTQALISDIPVFKEIYDGFPVIFFRAGDANDLKEKIVEQLLNHSPASVSLPEHLAKKYTFEKTASTILKEIE